MCQFRAVLMGLVLSSILSTAPLVAQDTNRHPFTVTTPEAPQKRALLIGVNDYAFINDLYYCGRDIQSLRDRLIAAGFPPDKVTLLRDGSEESRYQPLKTNIERELDLMIDTAKPGDLLLVAFSGHGVHLEDTSYLCPIEARLKNPQQTLVSLEHVYRQLASCPGGQKVLLVDACRNDPRPGGEKSISKPTENLDAFARSLESPPEGILVFTSCEPGQVSVEDEDLRHGVFMHFVLEGLEGEADRDGGNLDKRISLLELYTYSNLKTKTYVARKRNLVQTPVLRGEVTGDYEIAAALPPQPEELPSRFSRISMMNLDQILVTDPDVVTAGNPQARFALRKAYDLLMGGWPMSDDLSRSDCEKAVAACNEAVRLEPQNPFAYLLRGIAYRKAGDFAEAIADFRRLEIPLHVTVGYRSLEPIELRVGDQVTGTVEANDRLTVSELRGDWLKVDSVTALGSIRPDDGGKHGWIHREHLKNELQSPTTSVAARSVARRRIAPGDRIETITADNPDALDALQRARDILADDVDWGYSAVRKDVTGEECDRAIAACDEAIRLEPENESAYLLRGLAYRKKNDLTRALADFRKAGKSMQLRVTSRSAQLKEGTKVIATLAYGETLNITKINGDWLRVDSIGDQDGKRGWINKDAIRQREMYTSRTIDRVGSIGETLRSTPVRREIINRAKGYIPYGGYLPF